MAITIVGLGPGDPAHLTREAWDLLSQGGEVYLRTRRHPTVAGLPDGLVVHNFDGLYEAAGGFGEVYAAIAARILELGRRPEGVVYAVPGHPLVGETSVQQILARAAEEGLAVRTVAGLSFVEPVLSLLGLDGLGNLQLADATELAAAHHPPLDPGRPALVGQLYGQRLASDVKLTLMSAYPDEHPVTLVQAAGTPQAAKVTVPLFELDRSAGLDPLTTLFVPPLSGVSGMEGLQETIAHLRAPDGCPWDREQTHASLRVHLLQEAYEVLEALDGGDSEKLCEELGDLLMQIAMHAQIAAEEGEFHLADVIRRIDGKLKRRHPHVFGDVEVRDADDVLRNWEAIKAQERAEAPNGAQQTRLGGIPATLPALARAQELGDRAARAGFDWPDLSGVLDKLGEEVAELAAVQEREQQARELGDVLFTLANVGRWLGVDVESALRGACDRFTARFGQMEERARAAGRDVGALTLEEQEALWQEAKRERAGEGGGERPARASSS